MQFSPLRAHASLLYTRDRQVKEVFDVFQCSSRTTTTDIDCIEVPFQSAKGEGSILVHLSASFPRVAPEVALVWKDRVPNVSPVKTDFQWGTPNVRLVSIVSNIWHRLGCIESPRKAAYRELSDMAQVPHSHRLGFLVGDHHQQHTNTPLRYEDIEEVEEDVRGLGLRNEGYGLVPPEVPLHWVQQFVATLSDDQVEAALTSSSHFERTLSEIGIASGSLSGLQKSWQAADIRQKNVQLARDNARMAAEVTSLNRQIAILKSEYEEKKKQYQEKNKRQEDARAGFAPENLVQQLERAVQDCETSGAETLRQWSSGTMHVDGFVKHYFNQRANYHGLRTKHQWALESIPISRTHSRNPTV